jgi:hypothetical protein
MANLNADFADHLQRIREIQSTRVWRDSEMSAVYKSARKRRLDVQELNAKAREIFAALKAGGDDLLQNRNAEARAEAEKVPSPEALALYTDEDMVLCGPLDPDVSVNDLIGK